MKKTIVKVYPSKFRLIKEKQLAWKLAEVASNKTPLNELAIEMVINRIIDNASVAIASLNRKPVITARYNISQEEDEGVVLSNLSELKVKNYSPKGYSLVILNHDYRTVSLAEDLMDNLNPKKFVSVPPDVFIKLINENIEH